ncbi:hypothetical protein SAMN02745857_03942 [Andreprevotia lacus DSM 23236]|jgi:hypothetical protein|uniref:GTPase n=1 Tax=Andreprevotia lacus DSM 23236 TaxID=1121001 RepID=A0A1W1Y1E5_9NEIS|nr:hypothetical protein [Andreprevotia lacus]SMC29588.1 hypothetical protein SAMN02745857_03942 [Andreprevotia lacus DSM 23236]
MSLSLNLPEIDPKLASMVETDPKKLREWLIGLPIANVIESGRMVNDALVSCNRTKIDADERIKLLEHYRTTLELLHGGLENLYTISGLPLRDSARQASQLARSLWMALADGYKRAITDKLEKRSLFSSNKQIPPLIQAALLVYYRVVQLSSRVYSPVPTGMWQEAHRLFRYAAESKILDEPEETSIALQYKRLLMLALADPQRYAPAELDKVIELTDNYAHLVHFQALSELSSSAGFFLVQLDRDAGPHYVGSRSGDLYDGTVVLIDTIELGKKLHRALAALEQKIPQATDRAKAMMWLELLRRVSKQWTIAPKRLFNRILADAEVEICLGLQASAACTGSRPIDPTADDDEAPRPAGSRWRVLNESPGGYAVRTRAAPSEGVRAGEIVALRPPFSDDWLVASVRWMQQSEQNQIEMGLQIMTANAQGVLIKPLTSNDAGQYQHALLLPEVSALKQPAQIAAMRGIYAPLRELSVLTPDGEVVLRATRLVEQQMGYDLFQYQPR